MVKTTTIKTSSVPCREVRTLQTHRDNDSASVHGLFDLDGTLSFVSPWEVLMGQVLTRSRHHCYKHVYN